MDIHLVSTLTADDESVIAPALLRVLSSVLDVLPIKYALRIDTPDGGALELDHSGDRGRVSVRPGLVKGRPFDS